MLIVTQHYTVYTLHSTLSQSIWASSRSWSQSFHRNLNLSQTNRIINIIFIIHDDDNFKLTYDTDSGWKVVTDTELLSLIGPELMTDSTNQSPNPSSPKASDKMSWYWTDSNKINNLIRKLNTKLVITRQIKIQIMDFTLLNWKSSTWCQFQWSKNQHNYTPTNKLLIKSGSLSLSVCCYVFWSAELRPNSCDSNYLTNLCYFRFVWFCALYGFDLNYLVQARDFNWFGLLPVNFY